MRQGALRGDLSLLLQGDSLGWLFGLGSLEELVRIGELLERSVYVPGSLRASNQGASLRLANPPLRLGAFARVRLLWDGVALPPSDCRLATDRRTELRSFEGIDRSDPLELGSGEGSRYEFDLG